MENEISSAITLLEYIGQDQIVSDLIKRIELAKNTSGQLEHILLCGLPDMGKRTLAWDIFLNLEMGEFLLRTFVFNNNYIILWMSYTYKINFSITKN